MGTGGLTPG